MSKRPALLGALAAANLASWAWAWLAFAGNPTLLGTALLAWVFGLRHAMDADHIAAIDNVVRKLMQAGRGAPAAGLWFALGHSTVVVLATLAIAATTQAARTHLAALAQIGSLAGTLISAGFLLAIALANLVILRGLWRRYHHASRGGAPDTDEPQPAPLRGVLASLLRPVLALITRSWQMYPLGILFGLGFDTATEIGLLGISATQVSHGLPRWQVLVFPALFTSGMALVDTADSILMSGAYGWAFKNPLRKLTYNLAMTATSVAVALLIGGLEVLGVHPGSGFIIVAVFMIFWIVSAAAVRRRTL